MVLQQDDLGLAARALDEGLHLAADGLSEAETWFRVRHEDRFNATHHDLIGTGAALSIVAGPGRTEDLVHRDGMDVANTSDAGQRQKVRVEEGLNGRLLRGFAYPRSE